ncbi:Mur ligase family protein [Clostridium sp. CM028]|uniref:Mur ligase family protein n=1 Tax=Clostridium sp. CM028 TaxID=2851575 RepID=UPI001C6EA236|nr:Mur ligase family protein [Clostridium sp. CM028]MBW9148824.1 Mur ligase family protein [Clostridium sp. CM028]WLC63073.1 Mur ligase family protein [Clostridium sp. CM028]
MFNIKIQSLLSILVSKSIMKLSKFLFQGGTNFPGKIALKLDKNILKTIANNYEVILITGTNGKTTTTSMIYSIVKDSNKQVITNNTGANMYTGIVACFISNYSFKKSCEKKIAVIEVDEANVKFVTEYISPRIITVTNLFRDQLDRYGEVYTTLKKILEGVEKVPTATLLLNGDESLFGNLNLKNDIVYYGFGTKVNDNNIVDINADAKFCTICKSPYEYNFITYNHLGDFYCSGCGYKRPKLTYSVDKIVDLNTSGSTVHINNKEYYINQPGTYNIYNALCAYSVAKLLGLEDTSIEHSLKTVASSFGRQETLNIEGKEVKIILVKNPAGYDEAVNTINLDKRKINLSLLLNDNYADGKDVSWIWDVNFERLTSLNINKIMISGIRLYDMAIRLKVAGFTSESFLLCKNEESLLHQIKACDGEIVYILATYTAMINLRKSLHAKGYIDKIW